MPRRELAEPPLAHRMRRALRREVAPPLVGRAHVPEKHAEQILIAYPLTEELHRRDDQPFLKHLGRERERARRHAADVGVVGAARHEEARRLVGVVEEDGRDHRHVGEVGAALVRIVEHGHVAGPPRGEGRERRRHARGHRAEVHGDVRRLRHEPAPPVEHRAREVKTFLDVRRKARAPERHAHLFGHPGETVTIQFDQNRVHEALGRLNVDTFVRWGSALLRTNLNLLT